jgi:hypothetical protein
MRASARAAKRKKKIPLALRGRKKWFVRLFNSACSIDGGQRRGVKAISGIEAMSGNVKQSADIRCKA